MATISRTGFGQVEPNHLSAQRTAQIYAQLPTVSTIQLLENGQYVKYNYKEHCVDLTGAGEWMMVFNEVKLYDDKWRKSYKDFAMIKGDYASGDMVPRVIKTNIGDIYTTNCVGAANTSGKADYAGVAVVVGDILVPSSTGYLTVKGSPEATDMQWQCVEVTTMPDGQPAVKLMRIN